MLSSIGFCLQLKNNFLHSYITNKLHDNYNPPAYFAQHMSEYMQCKQDAINLQSGWRIVGGYLLNECCNVFRVRPYYAGCDDAALAKGGYGLALAFNAH